MDPKHLAALLVALLTAGCTSSPTRAERWRARLAEAHPEVAELEVASPRSWSQAALEPARQRSRATARTPGLRIYDVRDLLRPVRDFPGPELSGLRPRGLRADAPRAGSSRSGLDEATLLEWVQQTLERDANGAAAPTATIENGLLIVREP